MLCCASLTHPDATVAEPTTLPMQKLPILLSMTQAVCLIAATCTAALSELDTLNSEGWIQQQDPKDALNCRAWQTAWITYGVCAWSKVDTLNGERAIFRGALLGLTMVLPRGFSRPTGDSKYGDSVGGPALGLSASPVLNLNIFFAPGLQGKPACQNLVIQIIRCSLWRMFVHENLCQGWKQHRLRRGCTRVTMFRL